MFSRLGSFLAKNSGKVLIISAVLFAIAAVVGGGVTDRLSGGGFANKASESTKVLDEIQGKFAKNDASMLVMFNSRDGSTVDQPSFRDGVDNVAKQLVKDGDVLSVQSYYSTGSTQLVSKDRKGTYIVVALKGNLAAQDKIAKRLRNSIAPGPLDMQFGGRAIINVDITGQISKDLSKAETISFAMLAVLMILVFRGFIASLLPLLLGGLSITGAFFVVWLLTHVMNITEYAINIITLLGLGLAVDYSLFIVSRFREELRDGKDVAEAVETTVATAGRTVFFSGLTVVVSLLGLLVFPLNFLQSMSVGGSAAVVVSMISALIVLPAVLRKLGHNVNRFSFGSAKRDFAVHKGGGDFVEQKQSIWYKTDSLFMRHATAATLLTFVPLLAIGSIFLGVHFASPDYRALPAGSQARTVSEQLTTNYKQQADSIDIIFKTEGDITKSENIGKLYDYTRQLANLPNVSGIQSIVNLPKELSRDQYQSLYQMSKLPDAKLEGLKELTISGDETIVNVKYSGTSDSAQAANLIKAVRTLSAPAGTSVLVGGQAAELSDLLSTIRHYIPYGLAIIVITLFLLLFAMLGSIVIPLKAIAMNVLSLSVAFGSLVWIFQDGHLAKMLGLTATGWVDATQPILIFAIAFGLSMDYSVFLYSRIKEQYDANGGDNAAAVLAGLQKTGSIITSAAVLLFVVVIAFATSAIPIIQQLSIGLALTVLVDAFIVRMILVPSLMRLLGKYNWWAPKPLKALYEKLGMSD